MHITNLFLKTQTGQTLESVTQLILDPQWWIMGNVDWWVDDPRQILLSCESHLALHDLKPWQLRENITLSWDILDHCQPWDIIQIWPVRVRLTYPCEPCRHLTQLEWYRIDDWQTFALHRWVLWYVLDDGQINIWDEVTIIPWAYPWLPNDNKARFTHIVSLIPDGQHISYLQMTRMMWVVSAYARVLPKYCDELPWAHLKVVNKEYHESHPETQRDYQWRLV